MLPEHSVANPLRHFQQTAGVAALSEAEKSIGSIGSVGSIGPDVSVGPEVFVGSDKWAPDGCDAAGDAALAAAFDDLPVAIDSLNPLRPPQPAVITINLPESADLYVNGFKTKSTGTTRTLITSELPDGVEFNYTISVTVHNRAKTTELVVMAGQAYELTFQLQPAAVLAKCPAAE